MDNLVREGAADAVAPLEARRGRELKISSAEAIVLRNFIYEEERLHLLSWAEEMRPHLRDGGNGRWFKSVPRLPTVPETYRRIRHRLQEQIGLTPGDQPHGPMGWYLSVLKNGAVITPHLDETSDGQKHLRCIVLLQKPTMGGHTFVEDGIVGVKERDALIFCSSDYRYGCSPVAGDVDRVACVFGYRVAPYVMLKDRIGTLE